VKLIVATRASYINSTVFIVIAYCMNSSVLNSTSKLHLPKEQRHVGHSRK